MTQQLLLYKPLNPEQKRILDAVENSDGLTATEIGLKLTRSANTGFFKENLNSLVKIGLIEKEKNGKKFKYSRAAKLPAFGVEGVKGQFYKRRNEIRLGYCDGVFSAGVFTFMRSCRHRGHLQHSGYNTKDVCYS